MKCPALHKEINAEPLNIALKYLCSKVHRGKSGNVTTRGLARPYCIFPIVD
jgi:hypothetical protein